MFRSIRVNFYTITYKLDFSSMTCSPISFIRLSNGHKVFLTDLHELFI